MDEVLILGGYGNFGKRISMALARHHVPIIIAGRALDKARDLAAQIHVDLPEAEIKSAALDVECDLDEYLYDTKPGVVVNTCGPFQGKNYDVAQICIRHKTHYIDL